MKTSKSMFLLAAGLILLGVVLFALQPGGPEAECATPPTPLSGWIDAEKKCPISVESYVEIRDYESSPKLFRIAGAGLVLAGVVVGVIGLVRLTRKPSSGESASPGAPPAA